MKETCFDESTIQAFLDGELTSDLLESVARHTAHCDNCALLLQEAEEESVFAFELLDDELNSLVPTERIRAHVYQAISNIEQPKESIWQKIGGLFVSLQTGGCFCIAGSCCRCFCFSFHLPIRQGKYCRFGGCL